MGHLYDRMAQDLVLRNFSPATRRNYLIYCRLLSSSPKLWRGTELK